MPEKNGVPFLDLVTPHEELEQELVEVFKSALSCAGFIGGPVVEGFERDFAQFCGTEHCIGVSSGTDALRFALIAAGIGAGGLVVTAPNTFIATTEAISQAGAHPMFVDIDERTYNLDPEKLREYLEFGCYRDAGSGDTIDRKSKKRVAAVVPVHLYGQPADMDPILDLAARHNLAVIEDACQAHGAEYFSRQQKRWRKAGSMGCAAAFSFYPGKNLGACGEAGAVTTNDAEMARKIRMLRDHGQVRKYVHELEGYNGRLDAIQAGILAVKLRRLAAWNQQRRAHARRYDRLLSRTGRHIVIPHVPAYARPVFHLYVVRVDERERLQRHLADCGIGTAIHYPIPLHFLPPYQALGFHAGDYPVAERVTAEVLSLPMFPGLTAERQDRVVMELGKVAAAKPLGAAAS